MILYKCNCFCRNGHMMTHRSKKPFGCKFEGCDKSYCDARSLRRHLENHHQTSEPITSVTVTTHSGIVAPPAAVPQQPQFQAPPGGDAFAGSNSSRIQYAPPPYNSNQSESNSPFATAPPNNQPQFFQFDSQYQQQFQNSGNQSEGNQSSWQQDQQQQQQQQPPQQPPQPPPPPPQQQLHNHGALFKMNQYVSQNLPNPRSGERSPGYLQQISPISPAPTSPMHSSAQRPVWNQMPSQFTTGTSILE